jgi:hypothetical protein
MKTIIELNIPGPTKEEMEYSSKILEKIYPILMDSIRNEEFRTPGSFAGTIAMMMAFILSDLSDKFAGGNHVLLYGFMIMINEQCKKLGLKAIVELNEIDKEKAEKNETDKMFEMMLNNPIKE